MPDGATPHLEEAEILRDLVRRFLSGETQDSLIRDLNNRGITTSYGKPWTRAGRWDAAQPDERREMLKLALCGRHLIVHPADQRSRTDVAARTTISLVVARQPTYL